MNIENCMLVMDLSLWVNSVDVSFIFDWKYISLWVNPLQFLSYDNCFYNHTRCKLIVIKDLRFLIILREQFSLKNTNNNSRQYNQNYKIMNLGKFLLHFPELEFLFSILIILISWSRYQMWALLIWALIF